MTLQPIVQSYFTFVTSAYWHRAYCTTVSFTQTHMACRLLTRHRAAPWHLINMPLGRCKSSQLLGIIPKCCCERATWRAAGASSALPHAKPSQAIMYNQTSRIHCARATWRALRRTGTSSRLLSWPSPTAMPSTGALMHAMQADNACNIVLTSHMLSS